MTRKPLVLVLHGPAGVGKDSLIDALQKRTGIRRATSSTTRPPRDGEQEGVDYHFLTWDQFERAIQADEFVEWARVYDDLKGIRRDEIAGPIARGEDLIIRTDVQGARTWRKKLEGAIFIFLMAEDREVLRRRLIGRGSESDHSLEGRLAKLEEELEDVPNNDYVVYNHHGALDEAAEKVMEIMAKERASPSRPYPHLRA